MGRARQRGRRTDAAGPVQLSSARRAGAFCARSHSRQCARDRDAVARLNVQVLESHEGSEWAQSLLKPLYAATTRGSDVMGPNSKIVSAVTRRTPSATALLVLTSLLMPGGVLLLAWMLGRRLVRRHDARAAEFRPDAGGDRSTAGLRHSLRIAARGVAKPAGSIWSCDQTVWVEAHSRTALRRDESETYGPSASPNARRTLSKKEQCCGKYGRRTERLLEGAMS